jgi:KipI family sensor histidine kinase inhibitor
MMMFAALGDSAVVLTLGAGLDEPALRRVWILSEALERARLPGITDVVAAYATVTVFYEAAAFAGRDLPVYESVCRDLAACAAAAEIGEAGRPHQRISRRVVVPVCYGGEFGPDLAVVASHCGISEAEVIRLHSEGDYRVRAVGFAPGFPYLAGLPESLRTPRRATPRTAVPAGSVGIGGAQTGVYPLESPGGWQLIGRTPMPFFRRRLVGDDQGEKQSAALLRVGDSLKFRPVDTAEFRRLAEEFHVQTLPAPREQGSAKSAAAPTMEVIKPGLLTTVQDLGRRGHRAAGVPLRGGMDAFALRVANLLVGNAEDAAGLEVTLLGPELAFSAETLVAVCGAEFEGVPAWRPLRLAAGERIRFGECRRGCRAYVAIAGGLDLPRVLGSRSTYLRAALGGFQGRALRAGDRLSLGTPPADSAGPASHHSPSWRLSSGILPPYSSAVTLRIVRGAQADDFGTVLTEAEFQVSPQSDRMGLRLTGANLVRNRTDDLLSSAVAPGTVQVPPDGRPILLMADAQTIGGYPQAAQVIGPDLPLAAQLRPGDRVRFREVALEDAHRLAAARERELAHLRAGLQL